MNKLIIFFSVAIGVVIFIIFGLVIYKFNFAVDDGNIHTISETDVKNSTYLIDGEQITLKSGYNEKEITTNGASKKITQYFGNDVVGDFNNDGIKDIVFLLTQISGGSGTFYYLAALVSSGDKFIGTNALLIGDRIAPQTTEFRNDLIIVNYAERRSDDPFSTPPAVGVSKYYKIIDNKLNESSQTGLKL